MTYEAINIKEKFEKANSCDKAELLKKYIESKNEQRIMLSISYL